MASIEHYEEYRALTEKHGMRYDESSLRFFNIESVERLRELYNADHALNNIPLKLFDNMANSFLTYNRKSGLALFEVVCMD